MPEKIKGGFKGDTGIGAAQKEQPLVFVNGIFVKNFLVKELLSFARSLGTALPGEAQLLGGHDFHVEFAAGGCGGISEHLKYLCCVSLYGLNSLTLSIRN